MVERLRGLLAEARHRARLDGDDGRIERVHHRRGGLGDQHRRQHLRELDQIDGRDRRRPRRLRHEHMIGRGIGDQRQDHVRIDVGHQVRARPARRRRCRASVPAGWSKPGAARSARKAPETRQAAPCRAPRPAGRAAFRCRFSPQPAGRHEIRPDPGRRPLVHGFRTGWSPSRPHYYLALILASLPGAPRNYEHQTGAAIPAKPLIHVAFSGNKLLWQVKVPSSRISRRGPAISPGWLNRRRSAKDSQDMDSWTPVPQAFRALTFPLPAPWEELFGPLRHGRVDDLVVVGQIGQSLDGRVATETGHSHYINGPAGLAHLHRLRALVDAVVIGVGTALADDPQLTVRRVAGPQPARVVHRCRRTASVRRQAAGRRRRAPPGGDRRGREAAAAVRHRDRRPRRRPTDRSRRPQSSPRWPSAACAAC